MDIPSGGGALAIDFANTLTHDGSGGVADLLEHDADARAWLAAHGLPSDGAEADGAALDRLRRVRLAARALLARAVAPHPASRADAGRERMPLDAALLELQQAVDRLAPQSVFGVADGRIDVARRSAAPPEALAPGILALAVLELLASPEAAELRACQAPRCVRYFVKRHGRQEWCKESCANRARVARHAERQRLARAEG